MDAIPSLCACTASCGAASIGYVYGRSGSAVDVQGRLDTPTRNGPAVASPPPPTAPTNTPLGPFNQHRRRPQSASYSHSRPLWRPVEEDSAVHESAGPAIARRPLGVLSDSAEGNSTVTSSWVRRVSTIAQSQDGSSLSSPRPSSPSLFSNGSNAPFFPTSQIVTPRNRLVKRSTSHRVLHSSSFNSSPLSLSQTPTFRRPATSHQRSEQLRIQSVRLELGNPGDLPQLDSEQAYQVEPERSKNQEEAHGAWRLYFEPTLVRFLKDTPLRNTSLSRGTGHFDTVRRIQKRPGTSPELVKPTAVKRGLAYERPAPSLTPPRMSHEPQLESSSPPVSPDPALHKGPRPRHSFSFGDIMSTPTPSTWKIRRGGSVKKTVLPESLTGRRVVSAPQRHVQAPQVGRDTHVSPGAFIKPSETPQGQGYSNAFRQQRQSSRKSSSPLPPLDRISAFEIDLSAVSRPESPSQAHHRTDSSPLPPSPGSPVDFQRPSSLRIKPHRTSRIPSDRASTVFSSDNEHSRVFSADGDDFDYRSETVYDSIRTDATSSSHSGAKVLHAESVFQRPGSPDSGQRSLHNLHDKLARVALGTPTLQDHSIVEEEEAVRTPVPADDSSQDIVVSQRTFPLSPLAGDGLATTTTPPSNPNTGTAQSELFWSIEEEDSNWGDTESVDQGSASRRMNFDPSRSDNATGASQIADGDILSSVDDRPRSSLLQSQTERGGRTTGRRAPAGLHLRSQSVPLPPETPNHRFNNVSKLDAWMLGGKGVSEDWDGDFEFDEPVGSFQQPREQSAKTDKDSDHAGVLVPPSILERQASVHGQFGQVKELTQRVEELRELHRKAHVLGILQGQSAELWKEAEGIIDLASLDEDDVPYLTPHSPNSSSFDFEAFEEDASVSNRTIKESTPPRDASSSALGSGASADASPQAQHNSTLTRPRQESIAKAKHVLENIHQQRTVHEPLPPVTPSSPRKLPFDTTSLRDLVTRAGVVTRALTEIVKRVEEPDRTTPMPDRRSQTPPNPAFSQIFQNSPSPPSPRRSPLTHRRRSSNGFLIDSPSPTGSERNGHMQIMSVV